MDNKIAGLIVLALVIIGGITYRIVDTGIEEVCRTGNGWTIIEDYGEYYDVQCQYLTKDWVDAKCSSFRATKTKERYGCNVVEIMIIESEVIIPEIPVLTGTKYICSQKECVKI